MSIVPYLRATFLLAALVAITIRGATAALSPAPPATATVRTFSWSGYQWTVKQSAGRKVGPGPCVFSDGSQNVWIDPAGHLHLRIVRQVDGWTCPEVICGPSLGYGAYEFVVDEVRNLTPTVVGGLFTWDNTSPAYAHRELDFEHGVWGNPGSPNFQAVVQPYTRPGNIHRYGIPLSQAMVHTITWTPNCITFRSAPAQPGAAPLEQWVYTGPDIPKPGKEQVRMNLWLFRSQPPADGTEPEMIVRSFRFTTAKK